MVICNKCYLLQLENSFDVNLMYGNNYGYLSSLNPHGGENYMFARSPFLRMTSLLTRNRKPVIIMGGEMDSIGNFRSGYDSIYGERTSLDSEGKKQVDYKNPMKRPIAGIKDVNVEYKGGGMKLGATREAKITWSCWSFEDLEKLDFNIDNLKAA